MGYATRYSLKWSKYNDEQAKYNTCEHPIPAGAKYCPECGSPVASDQEELIERYIDRNSDTYYGIDSAGDATESCKWYDHETDVKRLSALFPGMLFTLNGEGEESGDIWVKYFLDGKVQVCKAKIVFDSFDPGYLK